MAFQFSPKIVSDGLVLYLDAANSKSYPGTGLTWSDLSRSGNNGTLTPGAGGLTFTSLNGGSLVFDGVDDYVEVNRSTSYDFNQTNSFTIAGWFYITGVDADTPYMGKWGSNSNNNGSYTLWNGSSGNSLVFSVALGGTTVASTSAIALTINRWNYFVGVYVAGTRLECYLNNRSSITANYTGNINNPTNVNFRISKADFNGNFSGNVSLVQIYNRALSASEVLQNYNATKSRFGL